MSRPGLRGPGERELMSIEGWGALQTMHCYLGEGHAGCFFQPFLLRTFCKQLPACYPWIVIRNDTPQCPKILLNSIGATYLDISLFNGQGH